MEINIGVIENYSGEFVHLWFYQWRNGKWDRIKVVTCHETMRNFYLKSVHKSANIIHLGKGTHDVRHELCKTNA